MRREEILNKYDFYSINGTTQYDHRPAKLLEDDIIYSSFNNWEKLVNICNNPPEIPLPIEVSRETFELWYAMIAKYIEQKPCSHTIKSFLSKTSLSEKAAGHIESMDKIRKNGKVVELLNGVKEEII